MSSAPPLQAQTQIEYLRSGHLWKAKTYYYLRDYWVDNKTWTDFESHCALRRIHYQQQEALIKIKRFFIRLRRQKQMETRSSSKRKKIKLEEIEETIQSTHPDKIPCPPEIEEIIENKKIKVEYDD
jgi:hypothetical protein